LEPLTALQPGDPFPPTRLALREPNGLLAYGGALDEATLLSAYRRGIFPWFDDPQPPLWWSPDPRSVLFPAELHVSRSLRRCLRRDTFRLAADTDFSAVLAGCAAPRRDQPGTWLCARMRAAYERLFRAGHAHSIEVYDDRDCLVGGLYGVALGGVFFGESMFSHVSDASKVALVALVQLWSARGGSLIDCQVENPHLNSLGARCIPRVDFERRLAHTVDESISSAPWVLPSRSGGLV
jgi:leucyl/phenylalanyl-tRNA--protein transferase